MTEAVAIFLPVVGDFFEARAVRFTGFLAGAAAFFAAGLAAVFLATTGVF